MSTSIDFPQVGLNYWRKNDKNEWVLGKLTAFDHVGLHLVDINEETGNSIAVQTYQIPRESFTELKPANALFEECPDMTSLKYLHEPAIVKNLHDRWIQGERLPYTRISNILIAVNPLRHSLQTVSKSIYTQQSLDRLPPHPNHIAENAYRQLRSVKQNQSIVISGESGSGKTETSKIILDYLTERSTITQELKYRNTLGDRLMETIPILESFGNAKTHRNHNSSRFGKYMRLQFKKNGDVLHLSGASIDTYLLETSRLVQTPLGERNFHIFYELLRSGNASLLADLNLVPSPYGHPAAHIDEWISQYRYLQQSGCITCENVADKANFGKLVSALHHVGIDTSELFRVLSGLLHLGNVSFDEVESSEGTIAQIHQEGVDGADGPLEIAASLLGLSSDSLKDAILEKKISRGATASSQGGSNAANRIQRTGSIYYIKRDLRQANYSRDSIAKIIYEHVFSLLMRQCADALEFNVTQKDELPYIGVLDIFGFEDFEPNNRNSLEQLMINYANETLQNMFNQCILKNEYELYQLENIFAPQNAALRFPIFRPDETDKLANDLTLKSKRLVVHYEDNKECISLLADRANGLFSVIDMVGKLAGPSDRKLNDHFHKLFKLHPCFIAPHPKDMKTTFIVKHFAGTVRYCVTSFLDKNNNIASPQFDELIVSSSLTTLNTVVSARTCQSASPRRIASSTRSSQSITQTFSQQMKGLVSDLEATRNNFIRCIKPNAAMDPNVFDRVRVADQLRCSGTIQACQVLQVGLPTRVSYEKLIETYTNLFGDDFMIPFEDDGRLFARALCYVLKFTTDDFRLGDSKLFFKTGKIHLLDAVLFEKPSMTSQELRSGLLKYIVKRRWITAVTKVVVLRYCEKIYKRVQLGRRVLVIQCAFRQYLARQTSQELRKRKRISKAWQAIYSKARIQAAFEGDVDGKLLLLQALLQKQHELAPSSQWLLTWLRPLQRTMHVKKIGRSACISYLCKQAFLALYKNSREKQASVKLQSQFRRVLATKECNKMRKQQTALARWRHIRTWIRGRFCFMSAFRRIHLNRLEIDNELLKEELHTLQEEHIAAKEVAGNVNKLIQTAQLNVRSAFEQEILHLQAQLDSALALLRVKECEVEELTQQNIALRSGFVVEPESEELTERTIYEGETQPEDLNNESNQDDPLIPIIKLNIQRDDSPISQQSNNNDDENERRGRHRSRSKNRTNHAAHQSSEVETLGGIPITSLHFGKRSKKIQMREEKLRRSISPARRPPPLVHQSSLD